MNKNILSLILVSTLSTLSIANANAVTASANAQWQATAKKDTKSELVVTPIDALSFNYAAATKSFNNQIGQFSVDIIGEASNADDFVLSASVDDADNILTRTDNSSTLTVGAKWDNKALSNTDTKLIVAKDYDVSNDLKTLIKTGGERANALGKFTFYIKKATKDGTANVSDYSELDDGTWSGNATVKFTATWTKTESN